MDPITKANSVRINNRHFEFTNKNTWSWILSRTHLLHYCCCILLPDPHPGTPPAATQGLPFPQEEAQTNWTSLWTNEHCRRQGTKLHGDGTTAGSNLAHEALPTLPTWDYGGAYNRVWWWNVLLSAYWLWVKLWTCTTTTNIGLGLIAVAWIHSLWTTNELDEYTKSQMNDSCQEMVLGQRYSYRSEIQYLCFSCGCVSLIVIIFVTIRWI